MTTLTLDDWLAEIYNGDRDNSRDLLIFDFKAALAGSSTLKIEAELRFAKYKNMIKVRGRGACVFSTKYHDYLEEALA